jgi:DNA-binding beta-propeller fold protein YncE
MGLAFTPEGDLYVTEEGGHAIRRIAFGTGTSATLAGAARRAGFADGAGDEAAFSAPAGIAVDANGQIFVADRDNHRIRKVVPRLAFSDASP